MTRPQPFYWPIAGSQIGKENLTFQGFPAWSPRPFHTMALAVFFGVSNVS